MLDHSNNRAICQNIHIQSSLFHIIINKSFKFQYIQINLPSASFIITQKYIQDKTPEPNIVVSNTETFLASISSTQELVDKISRKIQIKTLFK